MPYTKPHTAYRAIQSAKDSLDSIEDKILKHLSQMDMDNNAAVDTITEIVVEMTAAINNMKSTLDNYNSFE